MRSFILSIALLFLAGCSGPARQQTEAEKTRAITKVFETKEQYTARTLDSAAVADFLLRHPDSKGDSAAIFTFYKRRGYHYAWFAGDSLSHAAFGFATLVNGTSSEHPEVQALNDTRLRSLFEGPALNAQPHCDSCGQDLEISLTAEFFHFANKKYGGLVGRTCGNWTGSSHGPRRTMIG